MMKDIFQYPDFRKAYLLFTLIILSSFAAVAQNGSGGVAQFGSGCTNCGTSASATDTLYECSVEIPTTFSSNVVTTVVYDNGNYVAWDTLNVNCATGYAVGNTLYSCGTIPNTFGYANGKFYSVGGATYSNIAADTVTLYAFEVYGGFVTFRPPNCYRKGETDGTASSSDPIYFSLDNGATYQPKSPGDSLVIDVVSGLEVYDTLTVTDQSWVLGDFVGLDNATKATCTGDNYPAWVVSEVIAPTSIQVTKSGYVNVDYGLSPSVPVYFSNTNGATGLIGEMCDSIINGYVGTVVAAGKTRVQIAHTYLESAPTQGTGGGENLQQTLALGANGGAIEQTNLGNLIPAAGSNLGSQANPWDTLFVNNSTIVMVDGVGNTNAISESGGRMLWNGEQITIEPDLQADRDTLEKIRLREYDLEDSLAALDARLKIEENKPTSDIAIDTTGLGIVNNQELFLNATGDTLKVREKVVGASQNSALEYARIETSANGTLNVTAIEVFTGFNTSVLDYTGSMVDLPNNGIIAPTTGLYRVSGGMNVGDLDDDNIGIGVRINGVDAYIQEGLNSSDDGNNSASDVISVNMLFEINAGDLVQLILESDNEGGTYSKAYLEIQRQPNEEVVLAGMVPVEDLNDVLLFNGSISSTPTTYNLDNGLSWFDVISEYSHITVVHGRADALYSANTHATSDLIDGGSVGVRGYQAGSNGSTPKFAELDNLNFAAGSFVGDVGNGGDFMRIYGRPKQKTVINTVDTPVNDQSTSGYYDIGDMRIQWGKSATSSGSEAITLPAPMANTNYSIQLTPGTTGGDIIMTYSAESTTGFVAYSKNTGGTNVSIGYSWYVTGQKPN